MLIRVSGCTRKTAMSIYRRVRTPKIGGCWSSSGQIPLGQIACVLEALEEVAEKADESRKEAAADRIAAEKRADERADNRMEEARKEAKADRIAAEQEEEEWMKEAEQKADERAEKADSRMEELKKKVDQRAEEAAKRRQLFAILGFITIMVSPFLPGVVASVFPRS